MRYFLFCAVLLTALNGGLCPAGGNAGKSGGEKWYGSDSRRAKLRFSSYALYKVPETYKGPVSRLLDDPEQTGEITAVVERQLQHMYGAFTTHPYFSENPGIPSENQVLKLVSAEKVPNEPYARINYSYENTAVFAKSVFSGGAREIRFVLPKDPAAIYSKGFARGGSGKNLCTDEHYNGEDDFWYFWNPYMDGCPIERSDLAAITAEMRPMNSTRETYPEYGKLYSGETIKAVYLVGIDENFRNGDLGRSTFREALEGLEKAGFRVTAGEPRRKLLSLRTENFRFSLDLRLVDPASPEFSRLAADAMKNSDIFLYDGHSGLGAYLDPARLAEDTGRELSLPRDRYQIFFFNGCSTFAYYNGAFFKLKRTDTDKRGTGNLDIITTGIGADFAVGAKADLAFLRALAGGRRPSWQEIMNEIRAAEGETSSLTHINGDEDNPGRP